MTNQVVSAYKGDPQLGHLSTPISDSAFVRAFIGALPAYRKGMAPLTRGLEIGLAHGYFLVGPEVVVGALRDYEAAPYLAGLLTAIAIVLLGTAGMGAHGLVSLKPAAEHPPGTDALKTSEGWSEMTAGFFLGGMGGAYMAYFLLTHYEEINAIFRGFVNN
ncbi:MAG TPA: photosystem I reaction center protein subunit XI [Leptolyngbyaceae cyanobacterium M65_K2018_010]|nr:photosystem I reaction center protein subunit XI [Leptolyngbyaceae cyanobacterium M65_K2018_010]